MIYTKQEEYEWVVGFIDGDGFLDLERVKSRDRFYYRPVLHRKKSKFYIK